MTYSLQQLQKTAHAVVDTCRNMDTTYYEGRLSSSQKKWLQSELTVYLNILKKKNEETIFIHPSNSALTDFFANLKEQNITFPENTTYLMMRTGESFVKQNDVITQFYDYTTQRHKKLAKRLDPGFIEKDINLSEKTKIYLMMSARESFAKQNKCYNKLSKRLESAFAKFESDELSPLAQDEAIESDSSERELVHSFGALDIPSTSAYCVDFNQRKNNDRQRALDRRNERLNKFERNFGHTSPTF